MARKNARSQVLDDHIGFRQDATAKGGKLHRIRKVYRNTLFSSVQTVENARAIPPEGRPPATCVVSSLRVLDFDHPRAEITQNQPRIGRRNAVSELEHCETVEWTWLPHQAPPRQTKLSLRN